MIHDIFNKNYYKNTRKSHPYGETLPPWCYTSEEFYAKEIENIFEL